MNPRPNLIHVFSIKKEGIYTSKPTFFILMLVLVRSEPFIFKSRFDFDLSDLKFPFKSRLAASPDL